MHHVFFRTEPFSEKSEFKDPLNEAFRTFLHISTDETKPPLTYPEEDADEYLEKVKFDTLVLYVPIQ